ncbi:flagellar M-ring protein [Novosphingobium sp. Rr 2-17]|uniref:flagellar basal-body MS-ring/collar protein FliF n=1 Tax=Novosphingobium sp. Rr 2-17 TaxID=555793 RepID=UPI0002699539|nr:flagellar basal-body MS-ring/collar protein FliF [Novosphingobium sp. Rr 2-17]EIZ78724.1 flagellar M-ring protein [Novosphingobium sp. Rr 2-17]
MIMAGVALGLLGVLGAVALRRTSNEMGFLYTDLDPSVAQSITAKLTAQNIPFQLSADGSSIMAPQEKLAELRMAMAADKLSGKVGYDVLDAEEPFGVSSSRARMNETRAIEGELEKSIQSLDTVTRARVHIVMPERTMFSAESRKATAGVTVKTNGRLPASAVQAIRYLVASSVPELSADQVSIVDQTGALLARAGEADEASSAQADDRETGIEMRMRNQIETMLEPIVGAGKVRAEVSAQVGRDQTREETNVFDPDKQVIGRQITVESGDQSNENSAAAPGATVGAQLPENQGLGANGGLGGDTRKSARNETSEDTTYENSQTRTVTVRSPGKLARLTVAVMIDGGKKGLPAPEIARLTRLVQNAVGFDAARGDSVIVESMAFTAVDPLADSKPGWFDWVSSDQLFGLLKLIVIAAVGLIALKMLRPKVSPGQAAEDARLLTLQSNETQALAARAAEGDPAALLQIEAMREAGGDTGLLDQEIALAQVDGRIKLSTLKKIGDAISDNPAESASVIRQWMNS